MLELIIRKLSENFPEYHIFNEKVSQNYKDDCFIVWQNSANYEKCLKNRYLATYDFSVFYNSSCELQIIADKLCEILSDLGECKSQKINYEIIENSLEISVSYKIFVLKQQEEISQNMSKFGFEIKL